MSDTFTVLFVCTGNICRSPFAEILTRHLIGEALDPDAAARITVASAGVGAVVGSGMHPQSRAELAPWELQGWAAENFRARQLEPAMAVGADLVLGAALRHRSQTVTVAPRALPVSFSLREFARLTAAVDLTVLPADPIARAHALVGEARALRGLVPPAGPDGDDVPDPIGQSVAAHHQAALLIAESVRAIVGAWVTVGARG